MSITFKRDQSGGRPAFPFKFADKSTNTDNVFTGISVREYYAGLAMQGLCAGPTANGGFAQYKELGMKSADALVAKMAVDIADALIAALAKEPT